MRTLKLVVAALVVAGIAPPALAQDTWEFRLTPYAWLARLKGSVGRFIEYCLDNPKDNALAAFEKIAK